MKCAIYTRVSSELSDVENSIQAQIHACRTYAKEHEYELYNIYTDEAISGKSVENRPAFQELIEDAKKRKFDIVLVDKLDRFSRSMVDAISYRELLKKYNIQLCGVRDVGLINSPAVEMIADIVSSVNKSYIGNLASEIKKGQKQNMRRGFIHGGCIPYGYQAVRQIEGNRMKTRLELHPVEAPIIKKLFEFSAEGKTRAELLDYLNSTPLKPRYAPNWTKIYIKTILNREMYTGIKTYEDTSCSIPAIIDRETFEKAREKRLNMTGYKRNIRNVYCLAGIVRCFYCGRRVISNTIYGYKYYKCYTNKESGKCISELVKAEKVEEKIKEILINEFSKSSINESIENLEQEEKKNKKFVRKKNKTLEKELQSTESQINNIINSIATGLDPKFFKEKLQELFKIKEYLQEQIEIEKKKVEVILPKNKIKREFPKISEMIKEAKPLELRTAFKSLIRVVLDLKNKCGIITILWNNKEIPFDFKY